MVGKEDQKKDKHVSRGGIFIAIVALVIVAALSYTAGARSTGLTGGASATKLDVTVWCPQEPCLHEAPEGGVYTFTDPATDATLVTTTTVTTATDAATDTA